MMWERNGYSSSDKVKKTNMDLILEMQLIRRLSQWTFRGQRIA